MTTPRYLSATNGFIPEATGQAIAYVRDPNKFKINQYVQLIRAPKPIVLYAELDPDQPVRVVTDQEFAWEDGDPRPRGNNNMGNFKWTEVRAFRRNYGYTVGHQAIEAAEGWNPKAFFNATILSQAMTNVTARFVSLMENTANWGSNFATAISLNGATAGNGFWSQASNDPTNASYLNIKKTILKAVENIVLATNGMVTMEDLKLVISPGLAIAMSETSEIHSYLEKQEKAIEVIEGLNPNTGNDQWGLPSRLYGLPVVVENAVHVTERKNSAGTPATTNRTFIKSDNSAVIVSRVGGLEGLYGAPSFSTLQRYYYLYDMAIEAFDNPKDKLFESNVVDQFKEVLAANRAGYLITNTLS